jgi:hypothetical protein
MDSYWPHEVERGWYEAHVGTENAAFDRGLGEYTIPGNRGFWLFEVRLKPEAIISDTILEDTNSSTILENDGIPHRYINRWEDPASIALVAPHTALEIVSQRWVSAEEATSRPNLFNLEHNREY